MKRTLALTGMTIAVCALAWAQDNRVVVPSRNGVRPRIVEANLVHGSITVTGGSGSDVTAELPGARTQQRPDRNVPPGMHRIDLPARNAITATENGDVVRISVGMSTEGRGLLITVPANTSLRVHTTHGEVTVTGVHGEIDAASIHGDITLTNVGGTVLSNTVHGTIKVTMDQVDQSKPLSFSTLNGNIDVTLPSSVRMNLKMKTDRGDIWSDFDVKLTGGGAVNGMTRLNADRTLRGTINGGGVEASFYTLNGRIMVRKK